MNRKLALQNQLTPDLARQVVLSSNHTGPVVIEGVARGKVPGTDIVAHFVVYKVFDTVGRAQINEDLYKAIQVIFDTAKAQNPDAVQRWIYRD